MAVVRCGGRIAISRTVLWIYEIVPWGTEGTELGDGGYPPPPRGPKVARHTRPPHFNLLSRERNIILSGHSYRCRRSRHADIAIA